MGGKQGKQTKGTDKHTKKRTEELDAELWKDKEEDAELIKLLLLGAGESGKSTLFKQMIKLFGEGFQQKDLLLQLPMIHSNTIQAMKELCFQSTAFGAEEKIQSDEAKQAVKEFMDMAKQQESESSKETVTPEVAKLITVLWNDPGIKVTYKQRAKFQLVDSAAYFFDNVDRLAEPNYVPTDIDVVRCRVRTTGIVENKFVIDSNRFLMVDVGGQRNERKKWIHCFENVTAVLFVVAISEYDQVLYEDGKTNRMDEALTLFNETCHSKWFTRTSFILFLNKSDLFKDKIKEVPLTVWNGSKGFEGDPHDEKQCIDYLKKCFESNYHQEKLYVHVTCATSSDNVFAVFGAVKDIIIQKHLAESGLI